jgi:hypothetical protein
MPLPAESVAVADFNRDGNLDIASVSFSPGTTLGSEYEIYFGDGHDGFTVGGGQLAVGPSAVIAADFDGDGEPDLAVIGAVGVSAAGPEAVQILLNIGQGQFSTSALIAVDNDPSSIAKGDFNGDAHLDLAVTNEFSDSLSILAGDGSGQFTTSTVFTSVNGGGSRDGSLTTSSQPRAVVSADFMGTAETELAVANGADGSVTIFRYQGGTVVPDHRAPLSLGGIAEQSCGARHKRKTGSPDLVVGGTGGGYSVSVLTGTGSDPLVAAHSETKPVCTGTRLNRRVLHLRPARLYVPKIEPRVICLRWCLRWPGHRSDRRDVIVRLPVGDSGRSLQGHQEVHGRLTLAAVPPRSTSATIEWTFASCGGMIAAPSVYSVGRPAAIGSRNVGYAAM